jgi:hypothetical protein
MLSCITLTIPKKKRSFKVECPELGAKDIIVYGPKDEIVLAEKARVR